MSEHPLSCKEFVELVTDYLEGTMEPALRECFEAHLAVCDGCDAYLEQMKQTMLLLGRLEEEKVPGEAMDRLMSVFRDWSQQDLHGELE